MRKPPRRHLLPAEPLFRHLYLTVAPDNESSTQTMEGDAPPITDVQLARIIGVSRSTIRAARERNTLEWWAADRWATRVGVHPLLLWPSFYDHVSVELDLEDCDA